MTARLVKYRMFRWNETFIDKVCLEKNKVLQGKTVAELAQEQNKHPVDAMLDLAVEEDLKTEFSMPSFANSDEEALATIIKHPLCLIGASDGGAHTKFLTTGRYPTHFLAHWVRDKQVDVAGGSALAALDHAGVGDRHS